MPTTKHCDPKGAYQLVHVPVLCGVGNAGCPILGASSARAKGRRISCFQILVPPSAYVLHECSVTLPANPSIMNVLNQPRLSKFVQFGKVHFNKLHYRSVTIGGFLVFLHSLAVPVLDKVGG